MTKSYECNQCGYMITAEELKEMNKPLMHFFKSHAKAMQISDWLPVKENK